MTGPCRPARQSRWTGLRYAHRADANPQAALDEVQHAWRQDVSAFGENAGQFGAQEAQPLAHRNAALEQEGAYLVDDAGALADQALAHAVQSLQVKLIGSLGGDELHGRALHRLGDRLSIAEIVLLALVVRAHVFCWHQPRVVTKRLQLATEMMRADARFHADQARLHVGKPCLDLAARPPLPQHDRAALILADDVERGLADIDADHGKRWNGGRHTELRVSRVRCGRYPQDRHPSTVEAIRQLGGQWPDREVAVTMNRMRCKPSDGKAWTTIRVRERLGIAPFDPEATRVETISADETATRRGICVGSVQPQLPPARRPE
jgi:hypothetical protein